MLLPAVGAELDFVAGLHVLEHRGIVGFENHRHRTHVEVRNGTVRSLPSMSTTKSG